MGPLPALSTYARMGGRNYHNILALPAGRCSSVARNIRRIILLTRIKHIHLTICNGAEDVTGSEYFFTDADPGYLATPGTQYWLERLHWCCAGPGFWCYPCG